MPPRLQLTTFFRLAEILKHHVRYTLEKSIVVGQIPKTQKQKNKKTKKKKKKKNPPEKIP
jgi:hypothetical protein